MWFSGLSAGLRAKGSLIWLPVKAHAWVVGQVPSKGCVRGNHTLMFWSLSVSLPPPSPMVTVSLFFLFKVFLWFSFFKKSYLVIFRQRVREREREGEKHQCVVASHVVLTGDLAHNPGMYPKWELNRWPFGLQPALNPLSYASQGCTIEFLITNPQV